MSKKHIKPVAAQAQNEPKLAPVAVLTITYAPPLQRVIAIQPAFPLQMQASDVLTILRAAHEQLIADSVLAQAKQQPEAAKEE